MNEYLTTREVAALLRLKERKVYDLAASGDIPCSRATGKLLFPRLEVEAWLARNTTGAARGAESALLVRPKVFLGSHDPLLEWALRESRSDLAMFFDGSMDGLDRFALGEGVASGLHIRGGEDWNVPAVAERFGQMPVVLVEWAWRQRGLVLREEAAGRVSDLADVAASRMVPRQAQSGSQLLLEQLLSEAGIAASAITWTDVARTEADAALSVFEGKADAAFGLAALAHQFRLHFVPVVRERFDILIDRHAFFEPGIQSLLAFCNKKAFQARAKELGGYDVRGLGRVHFNGPA